CACRRPTYAGMLPVAGRTMNRTGRAPLLVCCAASTPTIARTGHERPVDPARAEVWIADWGGDVMKPSFGFIARRREMSGPVGNVIVNTLVWLLMLAGAVSVAQAQTGALTVGLSTEPTILDPQQVGSVPDHNVTRNIFDSLLVRDENLKL